MKLFSSRLFALTALTIVATFTFVGCGGGSSATAPSSEITVTLNQNSATLDIGDTMQFAATVKGSSDTAVVWAVDAISGGNATEGSISKDGLYTAPAQAGTHKVTAASAANTEAVATAVVTVNGDVSISPPTADVIAGGAQQFTAAIKGTTGSVNWSVDGTAGGSATAGIITPAGLYTAPAQAGPHTITATSSANPSTSATAPVSVFTFTLTPAAAILNSGASQQFTAAIQGLSSSSVTWSVDGVSGGNQTVGTVGTTGLYTAPIQAGSHKVTATSVSDNAAAVSASLTIQTGAESVSPASVDLTPGATQPFSVSFQGLSNNAATWSVDGVAGGNATTGTISASGLYTAPAQAGSHTVTATSIENSELHASAAVSVLGLLVSPPTVTIEVGATQQFTATIQGIMNTNATWSVDGIPGGNATTGTVNATGLYTAPTQAGPHTVTANSVGDSQLQGSAALSVLTIAVSPTSATMEAGSTQQFTSTIQGTTNTGVTWSVDGISGGNSTVGTVSASGLYTAPASANDHTVTATSLADPSASASAAVAVFTLSILPTKSVVPAGGAQQFSSALQGLSNTAVTWSVDGVAGGNSTTGTITSSGLYTSPFATGLHTVTATSVADPYGAASTTITLANSRAGTVLTYHNDDARDGANTEEIILNPTNVNPTQFGKLYSYPVDAQIYTQPLYLPQVNIAGTNHNVVFVATENNTVYAFDANGLQTAPLWSVNLGPSIQTNDYYGIYPLLGTTSTPVIDVTTGTLYVLAETVGGIFHLHALDVTSGAEKFGGPADVTGSVPGTGYDSVNGTITLETECYQRMGLALNPTNNTIDMAFGHCNHGWLVDYDKTTLMLTAIYNDTPDGGGGGLWGGGGAPAIDDTTGDFYLISGVDTDDPLSGYNDSFQRLLPSSLALADYFTPDNASVLDAADADLGSGANILMPDNPSSTPHETIGGGKDGRIFVINRDDMGQFFQDSNNVVQIVQTGVQQYDNIFSTPAFWNGLIFYHDENDVLQSFSWSNGLLSTSPVSQGSFVLGAHGATASVSANGTSNGIVWEIDNSAYSTTNNGACVLRAYNATNLSQELYDSSQAGSRDTAGLAVKFTVPTVIAGQVYVGTSNELDIYGELAGSSGH